MTVITVVRIPCAPTLLNTLHRSSWNAYTHLLILQIRKLKFREVNHCCFLFCFKDFIYLTERSQVGREADRGRGESRLPAEQRA